MTQRVYSNKEKSKSFLSLFILLALIWLALTSSLRFQEVTAGILVSFILSLFLWHQYLELGLPSLGIKKFLFSLAYLVILSKEIVIANLAVAYKIIHPKMPIKPGIVIVKTKLKSNLAKMILANSITLTPGTFTLDISGDTLLIHWIKVKAEDPEKVTKIIGEKFEKYLRVIFEDD